jgi:hypothetical protein
MTAPAYRRDTAIADPRIRSRRILKEMNDKADRAADEQVARSTPMAPIRLQSR